jgi:hypothetical protein
VWEVEQNCVMLSDRRWKRHDESEERERERERERNLHFKLFGFLPEVKKKHSLDQRNRT